MSGSQTQASRAGRKGRDLPSKVGKGRSLHGYAVPSRHLGKVKWSRIGKGGDVVILDLDGRHPLELKGVPQAHLQRVHIVGFLEKDGLRPAPSAIDESAFRPGARARALLQGARLVEKDLQDSGGAFGLEEVRRLLHGVSRQAIHKRVQDGSLLAVPGPSNRSVYPVAQFGDDGAPVEGLRDVRRALGTKSPWMVLNFLVTGEPRLGGRKPIDLLKAGRLEPVLNAARRAGVQGA